MKVAAIFTWILLLAGPAVGQHAPVRILIAYHSETAHTEALARAVREGAVSVAGVQAILRSVKEVTTNDIVRADGILLGTPVHWWNMSAESKRFLDRVAEALTKADKSMGEGRTAGVFCTAGAEASGKDMTRMSVLAAFLSMRFVVIGGVDEEGYGTAGAQATTGPTDPGVSEKERDEARRFGERFGRITRQLRIGRAHGD